MAYKGKYTVVNKDKYVGDVNNVIFRSLWERQVFKWLDHNDDVLYFSSEELVIPYLCSTDNKMHKYYTDLTIKFKNGVVLVVEIKPHKQTIEPKYNKNKTKKFITESLMYEKNKSKWIAAQNFCNANGWIFEIWDEHKLKALGIKIDAKVERRTSKK